MPALQNGGRECPILLKAVSTAGRSVWDSPEAVVDRAPPHSPRYKQRPSRNPILAGMSIGPKANIHHCLRIRNLYNLPRGTMGIGPADYWSEENLRCRRQSFGLAARPPR
jgi:hypothetical protein